MIQYNIDFNCYL